MSSRDQATVNSNDHSSQHTSQGSMAGIGDKVSGVVGVIHGTEEVIRGHAMGTRDRGRGNGEGKAIAAAGRERVERGLDKLEGKPARTSAAGVAPTGRDSNAPQPSTATADPRDRPVAAAANGQNGHHDADVESRTASGDPDKQSRDVANGPRRGNATGQRQEQQPPGTEAQTEERRSGRPADADSG